MSELFLSTILVGIAVVLFGFLMLLKPSWFLAFSKARLEPHGGLDPKLKPVWQRWHQRSAVFCVGVGFVMIVSGSLRTCRSHGPFSPGASLSDRLSAFSMRCEVDRVTLTNQHDSPIWLALSQASVFRASTIRTSDEAVVELENGWVSKEPVEDAIAVQLNIAERIRIDAQDSVSVPLFGLSSADCGGGVSSFAENHGPRELRVDHLRDALLSCDRLQLYVGLSDSFVLEPPGVGWRLCAFEK